MPVAALADIHGNVHALDAVLADPRFPEADRVVVLGDVVAGTFPAEVLERLDALGERVQILRGNGERIVFDEDGESSIWVRERLGPERLRAVASWPATFAIEVDGLGPVRCCHALPDDDARYVTPLTPEADFAADLEGIVEPTVIGGHTHVRMDRRIGRWRYVNVGAVGRPYEGRPGAYWALLGPEVELLRTEYDVEAAAAAVRGSGQPLAEQIAETLLDPPTAEEAAAFGEETRLSK